MAGEGSDSDGTTLSEIDRVQYLGQQEIRVYIIDDVPEYQGTVAVDGPWAYSFTK